MDQVHLKSSAQDDGVNHSMQQFTCKTKVGDYEVIKHEITGNRVILWRSWNLVESLRMDLDLSGLLRNPHTKYVTTHSVTGFSSPKTQRRICAPFPFVHAKAALGVQCYGGCAREGLCPAGFLVYRSANPLTAAALNRLAAVGGSSLTRGAVAMQKQHARIPSTESVYQRISAHKAMALAALHANSSLSTRLNRYHQHMSRARALEVEVAHG